ncbi:MAG: prepilin-type N-terminal cleavage/methylation domain-containing protein [Bdellovibrio sp.]
MLLTRNSQRGFSLVELMVVVAIIGILASIAIPSVNKYMAKARQSEAKTNLGSLYTAEKAFFAEYGTYDRRFGAVGFTPEGGLRYNVGFTGGVAADASNGYTATLSTLAQNISTVAYCAAANSAGCSNLNGASGAAPPAIAAAMCPASTASNVAAGCVTASNTFQAGAGAVLVGSTEDHWAIDSSKSLRNVQDGVNGVTAAAAAATP